MSYSIHQEQSIPGTIENAWEFFSRAENLGQITPPDIGFEITNECSKKIHEGQIICYKIKILPFVRITWVTEITHVEQGKLFVDDQRIGPYKLWHHTHEFVQSENGVLMKDTVHYALPFGIFGKIAHLLFVKKKLSHIFDYRAKAIKKLFKTG